MAYHYRLSFFSVFSERQIAINEIKQCLGSGDEFEGLDIWETFKNQLLQDIVNKGRTGYQNESQKFRPDWNKVNQYLMGDIPLNQIGCSN